MLARLLLSRRPGIGIRVCYVAGADVGTSCSYQATFAGFEKAGISRPVAEELFARSINLATAARDDFWDEYTAQVYGPISNLRYMVLIQILIEESISIVNRLVICCAQAAQGSHRSHLIGDPVRRM
jgi:hypothetical protein